MHYLEIAALVLTCILSTKGLYQIRLIASRGGTVELASIGFNVLSWASIAAVLLIPLNYLHLFWLIPASLILCVILCLQPTAASLINKVGTLFFIGLDHENRIFRRSMISDMSQMFAVISSRSGEDPDSSLDLASQAELRWIHYDNDELKSTYALYKFAIKRLQEDPNLCGEDALQEALENQQNS